MCRAKGDVVEELWLVRSQDSRGALSLHADTLRASAEGRGEMGWILSVDRSDIGRIAVCVPGQLSFASARRMVKHKDDSFAFHERKNGSYAGRGLN